MDFDPAMQVGRRLGRYTLVRSLGAGGMAELFLARADGIGGFTKLVAIKRILPQKARNERFVRMLLNEAKLVAALEHPNIAAVYDICFEDNEYFFAMEYVHGQDLRRVIRAAPQFMLRLENILHIGIGICAGLHHAHVARDPAGKPLDIVHRDVSPSNVLVSYQGAVKLVDFGVAKAATMISETREGIIKGKHGYMSPEQCLGEKLDHRSDLFAVGILLWEMTAGRRLYKMNGEFATLQRIVYVDAPRPSKYVDECPPELEDIIMRALSRDVAARYQTAEELQLDLEAFARAHTIPVSPVGMAGEMSELFQDRIDAWREAERAGRSLADHLADISSEDAVYSGSGDSEGGNDNLIVEQSDEPSAVTDVIPETLAAKRLAPRRRTAQGVAANPPPAVVPPVVQPPAMRPIAPPADPPTQSIVTRPGVVASPVTLETRSGRGSRAVVIGATVAVLGAAAAAVWFLWFRDPSSTTTDANHVQVAGLAADAGTARPAPPAPVAAPDAAAAPTTAIADGSDAEPQEIQADHDTGSDDAGNDEDGSDAAGGAAAPPEVGSDATVRPPRGTRRVKPRPTATRPKEDKVASPPPKVATTTEPCQPPGRVDPFDKRPICATAGDVLKVAPPPPPPPPPPPSPPPPAKSGPPPGTVDPVAVRGVVKSHLGEIGTCVSRARMDDRDLAGKVQIRIDVSPEGRVTRTSVASSTGATPALEACMQKAVSGWTFPPPAGGVRGAFSYPFAF